MVKRKKNYFRKKLIKKFKKQSEEKKKKIKMIKVEISNDRRKPVEEALSDNRYH